MLVASLLMITLAGWIQPESNFVFSKQCVNDRLVILDAGHGGADGGAVSADGAIEREINLEVAKRMAYLMVFCGQRIAMTRTDANGLASPDAKTIREQKKSDLNNRVETINSLPDGLLISIHQNSLPGHPEVYGAQVFYNEVPQSAVLAEVIQGQLNNTINAGNEKLARRIDDSIYLMKKVTCPAILVECGFLSNTREAHTLCTEDHQKRLALALTTGYLLYTSEGIK